MLLVIPVELRLLIYGFYLDEIRHIVDGEQPLNTHYSLLRTCRQLAVEAGPILRPYISLRNERQICAFISCVGEYASQIRWADVASDGRTSFIRGFETVRCLSIDHNALYTIFCNQARTPASQLHLALRKMSALQHLRIFECCTGFPLNLPRKQNLTAILNRVEPVSS